MKSRQYLEMSSVARSVQSGSDMHTQSHRLAVGAARRIGKQLTRATWIVVAFGIFYPHPYRVVMALLVALPLIAVVLFVRKTEMYQIIDRKHDLRSRLVIPFMMPPFALFLRAMWDVSFLNKLPLAGLCIVAGLALAQFVISADRQLRAFRVGVVTVFLVAQAYSFGAITQLDILPDRSAPQRFETQVISKSFVAGQYSSWLLHVGPWGPQSNASEIQVSRDFYQSIQPNQTICIYLRRGFLRIPWYIVRRCG